MGKNTFQNIDDYISGFSDDVVVILNDLRACIQKAAPQSEEAISYNLPAFKLKNKVLVYFAAFKTHIGFYALPSGNAAFHNELSSYKTGKGSIQFPINQKMPFKLIVKIVKFRIEEIEKDEATTKL